MFNKTKRYEQTIEEYLEIVIEYNYRYNVKNALGYNYRLKKVFLHTSTFACSKHLNVIEFKNFCI